MAAITDKFGKASIDTDYAIATTVKTTRVPGATVLEAFDLSKFSDDTPVFFVTYKKTTDPVTDITSVTNLVSWKGLVNTGANTLTNLELAPGYADTGNAIGDFIECIPTSHWVNSLIEGIFVSHNPDGSLKPNVVTTAKLLDKAATLPKINGGATAGLLKTDTSGNVTASTFLTGSFHMNSMTYGIWSGNSARYRDISFGVTLPVPPTILATVWNYNTASYGTLTTAVTSVTTTGCRIWINADINTDVLGVYWLAV